MNSKTFAYVLIVSIVLISVLGVLFLGSEAKNIENYYSCVEKAFDETNESVNCFREANYYYSTGEYSKAAIRHYDAANHMEIAEHYFKDSMKYASKLSYRERELSKSMGMYCYHISMMHTFEGEICDELAKPQPDRERIQQSQSMSNDHMKKASEYYVEWNFSVQHIL
jgi:hypothetical protein